MQPADKMGHGGVFTLAPLLQSFVSHNERSLGAEFEEAFL